MSININGILNILNSFNISGSGVVKEMKIIEEKAPKTLQKTVIAKFKLSSIITK